jgi:hypothetical protein
MSSSEPPFMLELTSMGGDTVATLGPEDDNVELRQWSSWLRVRSDVTGFVPPAFDPDDDTTGFVPPVFEKDGLALLSIVRGADSLPGSTIGLFYARIYADELERLRSTIEGTPWLDLPRPVGGDFNANTITIDYRRGAKLIKRSFNARNGNFIEAIAPLWELLHATAERANKTAANSLKLTLDSTTEPDHPLDLHLTLRLTARGIGPIALTDPRLGRCSVGIGEQSSDDASARPQNWVELAIPEPEPDDPTTVILRPNKSFEWQLRYRVPKPGRYLIHASWQDYGGPIEPVPRQTPFMPLPTRGPSALGSGPYPIRGALFATKRIDLE